MTWKETHQPVVVRYTDYLWSDPLAILPGTPALPWTEAQGGITPDPHRLCKVARWTIRSTPLPPLLVEV